MQCLCARILADSFFALGMCFFVCIVCVGPPVNALPDGVLLILVKCFVLIYINGFCASNMLDSNAHNLCLNKHKKNTLNTHFCNIMARVCACRLCYWIQTIHRMHSFCECFITHNHTQKNQHKNYLYTKSSTMTHGNVCGHAFFFFYPLRMVHSHKNMDMRVCM